MPETSSALLMCKGFESPTLGPDRDGAHGEPVSLADMGTPRRYREPPMRGDASDNQ
jgi:hypothetical protein